VSTLENVDDCDFLFCIKCTKNFSVQSQVAKGPVGTRLVVMYILLILLLLNCRSYQKMRLLYIRTPWNERDTKLGGCLRKNSAAK